MIYTSYFAKLRSLPDSVVPIAICAKTPEWFIGASYRKLAPHYDCLMNYKKFGDVEKFTETYKEQVLSELDASKVVNELRDMLLDETNDIALICYEKPTDFCHRQLVAEWLRSNGVECKEWGAWMNV